MPHLRLLIVVCFLSIGFSSHAETSTTTPPTDTIKFRELVFSNYFTPNGDGHNDTFIIQNIENYPNGKLRIFNRWGELVYEASPYQNDWNGKANAGVVLMGGDCPEGVYLFQFLDGELNQRNGELTLKR